MIDRIFIRAYTPPWGDYIQVLISRHENGKFYSAKEIVFKESSPAEWQDPTIHLLREDAQMLMDSLWSCGLRPTEGAGSAGALSATQKHLDDMRKIAFDLLETHK